MITGTLDIARIRASVCQPSSPGIVTSRMTRSGGVSASTTRPRLPVRGAVDLMTEPTEVVGQQLAQRAVVVDDEDRGHQAARRVGRPLASSGPVSDSSGPAAAIGSVNDEAGARARPASGQTGLSTAIVAAAGHGPACRRSTARGRSRSSSSPRRRADGTTGRSARCSSRRDARAMVGHGDHDRSPSTHARRDLDRRAGRRVVDGVLDEVPHDLLDEHLVRPGRRQRRRHDQRQRPVRLGLERGGARAGEQRLDRDRRQGGASAGPPRSARRRGSSG